MENFIKNLARGAGEILRNGFGKKLNISLKSEHSWDIVTQYDLAADNFVIEKIRRKYPNHGIFSEESGHLIKRKNFWLIDPLDGTHAFAKNLASFSVSIAYVSNNQIKLGAVYAPMTDEMFFAKKGHGAFLNNKKIAVGMTDNLDLATTALVTGSKRTTKKERAMIFKNVVKYRLWLSRMESAALSAAYAAAGRYDIWISNNLDPWDYAAGALILKEAGAKITDFRGLPYRWNSESIVAANPKLHKLVIKNFKLPK